jgi:predicted P-loop ATPase
MGFVTLIKAVNPSQLGKVFTIDAAGELHKKAAAQLLEGQVATFDISKAGDFVKLLRFAADREDSALILGQFQGAAVGEKFTVVPLKKLAKLLKTSVDAVPGGIVEIDGKKYAARVKRGIIPSEWILIDADNPEGMPKEQTSWDIQTRLEYLELIVPGISACERIEMRSSSARVHKQDEQPGKASHAFIQVSDPEKVELLREHLKVEMQLSGRCFDSPRKSRETDDIIGHEARAVIDLAVWVTGRLVFTAKSVVVAPGYHVADASICIVNEDAGVLDLSGIKLPNETRLGELREVTGRSNGYSKSGSLQTIDKSSLTLDTTIEINGVERPLQDVIRDMQPGEKVRCETPLRASNSEAAFIRLNDSREPCLYDTGTSTIYFLSFSEKLKLGSIADASLPALFANGGGGTVAPLNGNSAAAVSVAQRTPGKPNYVDLIADPTELVKQKDRPLANIANILRLIAQSAEWDGIFAYNEFTDEFMLMRPVLGTRTPRARFKPRQLKDSDFIRVQTWFQRKGFPHLSKQIVIDAVLSEAEQNVISPVRNFLEDIEKQVGWSPETHEKRLHLLCEEYLGAVADEKVPGSHRDYLKEVSRRFMVAAVARAMQPGCKVDSMLVLEGTQGAGKSTAIRILAGDEWFSDSLPNVGTKDASDHVRGKWFIEIGELAAMGRAEIEANKAFISRQEERYRRPYDRSETRYKRRCVFVGTTNQDNYLRDETGNRRFWPVRVGKVDLATLKRDRELLWAEAIYWYRQGKPWHMTREVTGLAEAAQLSRVSEDIWQAELERSLESVDEVSLQGAAAGLLLDRCKMSRADQNRLTACLKAIGFVPRGKFTGGENRNAVRYVRAAREAA